MYKAYHLGLSQDEVQGVPLALLPGAPERTEVLARAFGKAQVLAFHREFKSVLAEGKKGRILVVSTGIGGPSLSIAVEELARLGVQWFIRVGTCGAIQEGINVGDLVISEGAVRLDGASEHYAPLAYPAVADWETVGILKKACEEAGVPYHIGITCSSATFYPGQERYDTFSRYVPRSFQGSLREWQALRVLNYEMEVATLFVIARVFGLRAGAVCGVLVKRTEEEHVAEEKLAEVEERLARVAALAASRILEL
ncbi:MAG: uridine phosphorylase [Candidatus Caldatribacterium sp.]|nr:uridine phosphorylase [Candidatus Caldatribacterium sp.]